MIPDLVSNELLKELKETSSFFGSAKIYTGNSNEIRIPVRKDRPNSTEQLAEGEGNTKEGILEYEDMKIGAEVIQNIFGITDECRMDTAFDMIGEMRGATVEDFTEQLALLTTKGLLTTPNNAIEGFMDTANNKVDPYPSKAATVTWGDLMGLIRSIKPAYRNGAKLYVSPKLTTEMLSWKDNNERPLMTATQTPDGVYGYKFFGYDVVEEYYMEAPTTGKFPALFCNFQAFYAYFIRINTFETEMHRRPNERITEYYTRVRLGGRVVRPKAGALLQVS